MFNECFKKDQRASRRKLRRELDDQNNDADEQSNQLFRGGDADIDRWEIRSSIGLDPTLDCEVCFFSFCIILILIYLLFFEVFVR